jgi:hypothetical protein
MSVRKCKQFLQHSTLQIAIVKTDFLKTLSPTISHRFLSYRNQHPLLFQANLKMASKWADGPFPLIETPEFRQKVCSMPNIC